MIDKTILHRLFCRHYSEMIRLARTLLYDDAEAEDTVQDVFVRLMQSDILPAEDKLSAYLMTGTPPKDSGTKTTIWVRHGIYDGFSWKNYSFTSWKWNEDDISHYLEEVAHRKDHHVRVNVCRGVSQKQIDRLENLMREKGVLKYDLVKQ